MSDEHLYPELAPYDCGMVEVEISHRLYFEQCGNPRGIPVVFLHGGPGSGCSPAHRRFFDPTHYRIVLFDQRGAGRSQPAGCLEENTTQALVGDMERLRAHLRIDHWLLYGGSWGALLALLYAQQYPQRVLGLVLRGVFLARSRDLAWFYGGEGVGRIFPQEYASFLGHLKPAERAEPVAAYYRLFTQADPASREVAARHWRDWEARVVRQFLPPEPKDEPPEPEENLRRAVIVSHYAYHDFFLGSDGVSLDFQRLRDKPCVIVHGQRDLVCPLEAAWTLHQAMPQSELRIVTEGGHVAAEPPIGHALVTALNEMAVRLEG
jgi:proline iminopeptidase